jgi:membrane-associated protease RseP (regulator of RpoE activity)
MGHYTFARMFNVPVQEFSIGFGYKLFQFERWNTVWTLRLIPLGGYVAIPANEVVNFTILGKDFDADAGQNGFHLGGYYLNTDWDRRPGYQEFLYSSGGIVFNLISAFIVACIAFMIVKDMSFLEAASYSLGVILMGIIVVIQVILAIVSDPITNAYGPVESVHILQDANISFPVLFVIISIAGAYMNMIPIPTMDGWAMLTSFYKTITGSRLSPKFDAVVKSFGTWFLIIISVLSMFWDAIKAWLT